MRSLRQRDVYTAREIAAAVGVRPEQVETLMATGELPSVDGRFVRHEDAVAWGRTLRLNAAAVGGSGAAAEAAPAEPVTVEPPEMFHFQPAAPREPALPAAISVSAHAVVGALVILITAAGLGSASSARAEYRLAEPMRLVFMAIPGPGGGGGGGGLRHKTPPPAAKREGKRALSSPLPEREPPPPVEPPKVEAPPPPIEAEKLPPVVAPVVTSASDEISRAGVMAKSDSTAESRGPGEGGGVGSGSGTGLGEGDGAGIGPGSGGGIGGGPYRPGSGIEPPALLSEVKPVYTEEARRRRITGEVVLEIVVRNDGRVGDVRVLEGLGHGLDERAVEAVSRWRFSPARRLGKPVDVLVEVAVEFRLR